MLRVLVLSILATLVGRLAYLQVDQGAVYARAASDNRIREVVTPAARGEVLDDAGRALVDNRTALVVSVTRSIVRSQPKHGAAVLQRLAGIVGEPVATLSLQITPCGEKLKDGTIAKRPDCWNGSPYQPVPIASYDSSKPAEVSKVLAIQEHAEDFPGVQAQYEAVRDYPAGALAAHVLGYLGPLSDTDLRSPKYQKLAVGSGIGRAGVEQVYDAQLRGADGVQRLLVDKDGSVTGTVGNSPAVGGQNLVLSLDRGVQKVAEDALKAGILNARSQYDKTNSKNYAAPTGAAIVMEAATGRLVAMASYPSYDPAAFVGGISSKAYSALRLDPAHPLVSNAYQGLYAPGSTFKLSTTAAAVAAGNSLYGSYPCPGAFKIGNSIKHNFEGESPGNLDFRQTLVKSCDTVYYALAVHDWQQDNARVKARQKPREIYQATARAFGFGRRTGIDLPSESRGTITGRADKLAIWKEQKAAYCKGAHDPRFTPYVQAIEAENCKFGYIFNPGDAANFAIGQGDVLGTPLQLTSAYGALANGGTLWTPRVAKALLSGDGKTYTPLPPVKKGNLGVPAPVLDYIRSSLIGVTKTGGTAQAAFLGFPFGQLDVAGKTGTADVNGKSPTSWFASYAPAAAPKFVVVVMIPEGGTGGTTAAPIVRRIWDGIYGLEGAKAALPGGVLPASLPVIRPDGSVAPPGTRLPVPPVVVTAAPAAPPGTTALAAPSLPVGLLPRRTGEGG